jgi:hypothetical protein
MAGVLGGKPLLTMCFNDMEVRKGTYHQSFLALTLLQCLRFAFPMIHGYKQLDCGIC